MKRVMVCFQAEISRLLISVHPNVTRRLVAYFLHHPVGSCFNVHCCVNRRRPKHCYCHKVVSTSICWSPRSWTNLRKAGTSLDTSVSVSLSNDNVYFDDTFSSC